MVSTRNSWITPLCSRAPAAYDGSCPGGVRGTGDCINGSRGSFGTFPCPDQRRLKPLSVARHQPTGRRAAWLLGAPDLHIYFRVPLLGTPISAESVTYAIAQLLRFGSMAAMGFPIAFAVAPGDIGPTFARLGVPYQFACALELTFRFVPSLASDLRTTIDAQRVRGHEWGALGRGRVGKVRRVAPLMVPLTMNAFIGAEDTIDAMDLRAFGTGGRTWPRELRFDRTDLAMLAGFALLLVAVTMLSFTGHTVLWVPPSLVDLAPKDLLGSVRLRS